MNATALAELAKLKQGARATWAAGDFPAIAQRQLWEVGPRIVEAVQVEPGEAVLDVACGTGNAALRAAEAGDSSRARRRSSSSRPSSAP
jgi:2-polyprenyl-3-methyl-5-hydroxy-6-metoxy-1,4-benzoquinol methylase